MATNNTRNTNALMVRMDSASKKALARAAAQARKELLAGESQTITMTTDEQLAFWNALDEPTELTPAQKKLGKLMRREP